MAFTLHYNIIIELNLMAHSLFIELNMARLVTSTVLYSSKVPLDVVLGDQGAVA